MRIIEWNDGRVCGGKYPRLYLVKDNKAIKFEGRDVPGWCRVLKAEYHPCGKWSNTDYEIGLEPGVRPIELLSPMHGVFGQDARTWDELAAEMQLPVEIVKEIVREEYPRTADRLDGNEQFLEKKTGPHWEALTLVLSSPTCRQIAEGYWRNPKRLETSWGEAVEVEPSQSQGWHSPTIKRPTDRARIAGVRYKPGYHGGRYEIDIIVKEAE